MFFLNKFIKGAFLAFVLAIGQSHAAWQMPAEFFGDDAAGIDIASDANGNAIVVVGKFTEQEVQAFYYSSALNSWTGPTILSSSDVGSIQLVDMDPSGTALAIWENFGGSEIHSAYFNGTTWTAGSPDPFATPSSVLSLNLDMNGPDSALAVWKAGFVGSLDSAFFSGGSWGAVIPIASSTGVQSSAAYSANGTAVAGFDDSASLFVSNFIGGSWQTPVLLDPAIPFSNRNIVVGIDDLGNALAVWIDAAGDVRARNFDGTTWLAPVTISTVPGNVIDTLSLGMAPGGTAVVTWIDAAFTGQSSSYNGTSWSAPIPFSNDANEAEVSVNASGDALVVFTTTTNFLFSSRLPLGGVWTTAEFIFEGDPFDLNDINSSLSDIGFGFAAWQASSGELASLQFASVEIVAIAPNPPETINGSICKNNFVTQTDRIHVITWTASSSLDVVSYNLSRNGVIIAVIPASGPFIYLDHNRCKKIADTYTLTAVNESGIESEPVTITLQ